MTITGNTYHRSKTIYIVDMFVGNSLKSCWPSKSSTTSMPSFSCSALLVALPGSRTLLGMPSVRILDRWHGLTRYVRNLGRDKEQVRTIRPQKHVFKTTWFAFIYWIAYLIKRMIHSSGRILRPGRQMWKSSKWSWLPGSHWFSFCTRHSGWGQDGQAGQAHSVPIRADWSNVMVPGPRCTSVWGNRSRQRWPCPRQTNPSQRLRWSCCEANMIHGREKIIWLM